MDPREVYLLHYANYTVLSPEQFTNECGITTYEHSWSSELLPADMDIWQVIEDPTGKYNNEDGSQPFAFELQSNSNKDVGNFTYTFKIRARSVNLFYIYWEKVIDIEIKPCKT